MFIVMWSVDELGQPSRPFRNRSSSLLDLQDDMTVDSLVDCSCLGVWEQNLHSAAGAADQARWNKATFESEKEPIPANHDVMPSAKNGRQAVPDRCNG